MQHQGFLAVILRRGIVIRQKSTQPPISHFSIRPAIAFTGIEIDHQMKMIAHDSVGIYRNRKVVG